MLAANVGRHVLSLAETACPILPQCQCPLRRSRTDIEFPSPRRESGQGRRNHLRSRSSRATLHIEEIFSYSHPPPFPLLSPPPPRIPPMTTTSISATRRITLLPPISPTRITSATTPSTPTSAFPHFQPRSPMNSPKWPVFDAKAEECGKRPATLHTSADRAPRHTIAPHARMPTACPAPFLRPPRFTRARHLPAR